VVLRLGYATLAWLGGGMALGTLVLGGITVGPALAIGGFVLASQGEKARTNAREYEAQVNTEVARIDAAKDLLKQVKRQCSETDKLANTASNLKSDRVWKTS